MTITLVKPDEIYEINKYIHKLQRGERMIKFIVKLLIKFIRRIERQDVIICILAKSLKNEDNQYSETIISDSIENDWLLYRLKIIYR